MAVSDQEVIRFANERARPTADAILRALRTAERFKEEWDVRELSTKVPNDETVIPDGADVDGRKQARGVDLYNLYNRCGDLITLVRTQDAGARYTQLVEISVNDLPSF